MARVDFRSPRLYVDVALAQDAQITLAPPQAHYLANVLRLKLDDPVLAFNGRDGEWRAVISGTGKRAALRAVELIREQTPPGDLHYLFAPLKHERLDYMVQKAVELGVSQLQPVITQHTQAQRINLGRMRANVIEAAEQCGILALADINEPMPLAQALAQRSPERLLVFCDEDAEVKDPVAALRTAAGNQVAVLIGPEGGFSEAERAILLKQPNVVRLSLGPRILRADTAAVAALTLVQATLGDSR